LPTDIWLPQRARPVSQSAFNQMISRESLMDGDGLVLLTSVYYLDKRLFLLKTSCILFNETSHLNEDVKCTELSPSVSFPGLSLMLCQLNAYRPSDFQTKGLELLKGLLSTAAA